jgi:hypothetical protein
LLPAIISSSVSMFRLYLLFIELHRAAALQQQKSRTVSIQIHREFELPFFDIFMKKNLLKNLL